MNKMQEQVLEFHKEFEVLAPNKPTLPDFKTMYLRLRLMKEELKELEDAMIAKDMVEIADGIADLLVVTFGTAISYGIDMQPIFDEVHRSNMSKRWSDGKVHYDDGGKVLKSPDYSPANLQPILNLQIEGRMEIEDVKKYLNNNEIHYIIVSQKDFDWLIKELNAKKTQE